MNATMSKQEVRAAYIESVINKIFIRNGLVHVPSSCGQSEYIVTLKDGKADDCGCDDHYIRYHVCKHMEATDKYLARQTETQQSVEVVNELVVACTPEVEVHHVHIICGGCGCVCGEGKGDRCHIGFCFWNSWWTERKRLEEDERMKLVYELKSIEVHNHRLGSAA